MMCSSINISASSSKLAVAAKGTFTLHTMGFKKADDEADDGTTTSGLIKSSILTTSLSARIAAPSEIRKGIGFGHVYYKTKMKLTLFIFVSRSPQFTLLFQNCRNQYFYNAICTFWNSK